MRCPECGEELEECVVLDHEHDKAHDGVRCPNGCNIAGGY
jgi:DNA-directed RNA polymerase subunit RPC12/RpoP